MVVPAAAAPTQSRTSARRRKSTFVVPRSFNDAQQIADRQASVPDPQPAEWTRISKRLIDFASGLTYALDGSMQRADKVFLLTPRDVELSAEERARALERGGFTTKRRGGKAGIRSRGFRPGEIPGGVHFAAAAFASLSRRTPASRRAISDGRSSLVRAAFRHRLAATELRARLRVDLHPAHLRVGHPVLGSTPVFQHGRNCAKVLGRSCVPYLRLFRWLPRLGPFDLSPIVGVVVLLVAAELVSNLIEAIL